MKYGHLLFWLICLPMFAMGEGTWQTSAPNTAVSKWQRKALIACLVPMAKAIRAQQRSDGAIVMGDRAPYRLSPYVANYAALGLLDAYQITHDPSSLRAVKRWQEWYLAHLNVDGTIYDYSGDVGAWQPTNDYDSTDAYAATFMRLVWRYAQVAKDPLWVRHLLTELPKLANAIRLTLQGDGLTTAEPNYPAMYTMDNVEVYQGWVASAQLAQKMHRADLAHIYGRLAKATLHAIDTLLWVHDNRGGGHFLIGIQPNGASIEVKQPMVWYPDQMAQLMAIAWLPKSSRTFGLYSALCRGELKLPSIIITEDELSYVVWWALAAETVGDRPTLSRILQLLIAVPKTLPTVMDVGLEGHVCTILAHACEQGDRL